MSVCLSVYLFSVFLFPPFSQLLLDCKQYQGGISSKLNICLSLFPVCLSPSLSVCRYLITLCDYTITDTPSLACKQYKGGIQVNCICLSIFSLSLSLSLSVCLSLSLSNNYIRLCSYRYTFGRL